MFGVQASLVLILDFQRETPLDEGKRAFRGAAAE